MEWTWLTENWEQLVKMFGIGVLFLGLFIWQWLKNRKWQKKYHGLIDSLYDKAYDIAIKTIAETLTVERQERLHSREKWEQAKDEVIANLKERIAEMRGAGKG